MGSGAGFDVAGSASDGALPGTADTVPALVRAEAAAGSRALAGSGDVPEARAARSGCFSARSFRGTFSRACSRPMPEDELGVAPAAGTGGPESVDGGAGSDVMSPELPASTGAAGTAADCRLPALQPLGVAPDAAATSGNAAAAGITSEVSSMRSTAAEGPAETEKSSGGDAASGNGPSSRELSASGGDADAEVSVERVNFTDLSRTSSFAGSPAPARTGNQSLSRKGARITDRWKNS